MTTEDDEWDDINLITIEKKTLQITPSEVPGKVNKCWKLVKPIK